MTVRTMIGTAMRRTVGPALGVRVRSVLSATRLSTRLWFDVLAPLAMFCVLLTHWVAPWKIAVSGATLLALHLGSTLVNDAMDVDSDGASTERSRRERVLVTGRGRTADFVLLGAVLSLVGIGLAFVLSPLAGVAVLGAVGMATAYNVPPVQLSGRPGWPQLMWPLIWLLMFGLAGLVLETDKWAIAWPFGVFVALFMGVGEGITQDVRDVDNDRAGGRRTTPVVFGVHRACLVAVAAQLGATAVWVLFCVRYPMPIAVAVPGTLLLLGWVAVLAEQTRRLSRGFDKRAAKLTHVGSIYTFGAINVLTIIGTVLD